MGKVAVVFGVDNIFGIALCKSILDKGWTVFGGMMGNSTSDVESLAVKYPTQYRGIPMDPKSIKSLEVAAETVASYVDHIDLLISNVDAPQKDSFFEGLDFESMLNIFDINALGPVRFVEAFLSLSDKGSKRLCFLSNALGSIKMTVKEDNFGYSMSKTALHMSIMIMFNHLRKEGYTFRIYIPGNDQTQYRDTCDEQVEVSAQFACNFFMGNQEDESRIMITDYNGEEWPF